MSALAAKVILGVVGVVAIPVTWHLVYHYKDINSLGEGNSLIDRATLSSIAEYLTGAKKDTFGGKLSSYFLDTEAEINKKMWDEKLNAIQKSSNKPNEDGFFKNIKDDNLKVEKLKEVCSSKYQENFPTDDSEKEKWDEVWKYCAIPELVQKPQTVNESNEYSNGGGSSQKIGQAFRNELISVENGTNEKFWRVRHGEFWAQKIVLDSEKEKYKFFYNDSRKDKTIKEICKEAYEKSTNTSSSSKDNPTNDEVKKFCSIEMIRFFE